MVQAAMAALWEAGLHFERMTGTVEVACEASAVIGLKLVGVGPERDPQGIPEESWHEGEACGKVQAVVNVAWEAWDRDASWVKTEVGLEGQEVEPESKVNEEKEAFEDGAMLQTV